MSRNSFGFFWLNREVPRPDFWKKISMFFPSFEWMLKGRLRRGLEFKEVRTMINWPGWAWEAIIGDSREKRK